MATSNRSVHRGLPIKRNVEHTNFTKARYIYGVSSWGTAAYVLFSVLATAHAHLAISVVSGSRFLLGFLLTLAIGLWTTGNLDFCRSRAVWPQVKRSTLLFVVTITLIAASLVLKNVAMLNAYTFSLYAIAVLRARFAHRREVRAVGWLAVLLCVVGVVLLAIASGSGKHPVLGLLLVLTSMYCQVMMLEQVAVVKAAGDSSLCSLFWSGIVGFGLTGLYVLFQLIDGDLGRTPIQLPAFDLFSLCMIGGVTLTAVLPQWGYAKAGESASAADLASAGLTQIVPAIGVQIYLDHGRLPSLWAIGGIVSLLASAWFGIQGQKPAAAASR